MPSDDLVCAGVGGCIIVNSENTFGGLWRWLSWENSYSASMEPHNLCLKVEHGNMLVSITGKGPWGSLASQPSLLGEFKASERLCLKTHSKE